MIICNNISVNYNQKSILKNINIELLPGRITSFIGVSGAGKTTLLKTIAHLNSAYSGTITINGTSTKNLFSEQFAQKIGYVFQQGNLFPHLTVLQNCMVAQNYIQKKVASDAKSKTIQLLDRFGIGKLADSFPAQLSGGQQQRVAIVRALCLEPTCLLLDEPTSALDNENTKIVAEMLKELTRSNITIAISSQDMSFLEIIRDRGYIMSDGIITEKWDSAFDFPKNI